MKRPKHNFSLMDARALAQVARMAPLQNMQTAEQVAQLLERFDGFVRATLVRPAPRLKNDVPPTGQ